MLRPGGEAFLFGPSKRVILNDLKKQLESDAQCSDVCVEQFEFVAERLAPAAVSAVGALSYSR